MPSPFPGMDPFIEQQEWSDFHAAFNVEVRQQLVSQVSSEYVVRVEHRVYFERRPAPESDELVSRCEWRVSDVAVTAQSGDSNPGNTALAEPEIETRRFECEIPMHEEHRESFLIVRDRHTGEIVTIIDTLSPANKRPGSDGQQEYLAKRSMVFESPTHLIELDLLRGGQRLPMRGVPAADFYAFVSRSPQRPVAHVACWNLPDRMPVIPIPLKPGDAEPKLDVQACLREVYQRARYELSLDYRHPLEPSLNAAQATWMAGLLEKHQAEGVRAGGSGTST